MIGSRAHCNILAKKLVTKQKAITKRMFRLMGGPWGGHDICLTTEMGDIGTADIAVDGRRGRYKMAPRSLVLNWEEK